MPCEHKKGAMEVDEPQAPNGHSSELRVNGLLLHPVLPQDEGEGLPYAPIDWPNPGDTWGWRVGKRTAISGYYLDRYLYLPSRLQKSRRGRDGFASKLSIEQYIQARFPGTDIEAFFASFSWKVPSKQTFLIKEHHGSSCMLSEELAEASLSDCHTGRPSCKAGNSSCPSLTKEEKVSSVTSTMFCDICCSEPSFCRECCCILCCKTIDFAFGGYSFMRCQSKVHDGLICAHAAHLTCALRSYLAGAVPGSIALDAQYYCRRCDSRTELAEHVTKVFKICESVDSREDIKKMLNLVICLLRGSQRRDAKRLLNRAQLVLQKFESGNVSDVWILEDDISGVRKEAEAGNNIPDSKKQTQSQAPVVVLQTESENLSEEIDEALQELRTSQDYEFKIAQKKLLAQKDILFQLYQQLDKEKAELAKLPPSASVSQKVQIEEKIKREMKKLKDMQKVSKGFGRVPRNILDKYFDLDMEV
ncbi:hypothetical protein V2J09_022955 [Rumex salicifolius]